VVDSYTSLKRSGQGAVLALPASATEPMLELEMHPVATPDAPPLPLAEPAADEVPGGPESGVFLHEVIEALPAWLLDGLTGLDDFRASPAVRAIFLSRAGRHGIPLRCLPHAEQLVFAALTARVPLGESGPVLDGLGRMTRQVREMGFVFPVVPGRGPAATPAHQDLERGYIKGYIDHVFAHQGRLYLCDWKSDRLASYRPAALRTYVQERYELQLQLYLLALVKAAGIADEGTYERGLGGILYCFLRGMDVDQPGAGVHFARPGWGEVVAWQAQLAAARAPLEERRR
jgi:exodeoxyribonuclease V beta subunit